MNIREEELRLGDQSVRVGVGVGIGFWLISILVMAINWNRLPPEIPWFYSLPWGESQLIAKNWLLVMLTVFGAFLVLNTILAKTLGKDEQLLGRILVWGAATFELLVLLGLFRVMAVVL